MVTTRKVIIKTGKLERIEHEIVAGSMSVCYRSGCPRIQRSISLLFTLPFFDRLHRLMEVCLVIENGSWTKLFTSILAAGKSLSFYHFIYHRYRLTILTNTFGFDSNSIMNACKSAWRARKSPDVRCKCVCVCVSVLRSLSLTLTPMTARTSARSSACS